MIFSASKVDRLVATWKDAQKAKRKADADLTDAALGFVHRVERRRRRNQIALISRRIQQRAARLIRKRAASRRRAAQRSRR